MSKVMIIDQGGRGHALARKYAMSKGVENVLVTTDNSGIVNDCINRDIGSLPICIYYKADLKDKYSMLRTANDYWPDLIDVAQDNALAAGTVELLQEKGFRVFGPTQKAAEIESNKEWSRDFMKRHNFPIPEYKAFSIEEDSKPYALEMLKKYGKIFYKATGLCEGKGVFSLAHEKMIDGVLEEIKKKGVAAKRYLIEQGLDAKEEFSYFALSDGKNFRCFKSAQDNKMSFPRDMGKNTGGMGAHSPAFVTRGLEKLIEDTIISKTIKGLGDEGRPFVGILYLGGVKCMDGSIKIIEFNARWGDPECHVILPGIKNDYFELINMAVDGRINEVKLKEDDLYRVCIVGTSAGYPGKYESGKEIWIDYERLREIGDVHLIGAGITSTSGRFYTNGGRVVSAVTSGENIIKAKENALSAIGCIFFEDNSLHYRPDIAWRDVQKHLRKNGI